MYVMDQKNLKNMIEQILREMDISAGSAQTEARTVLSAAPADCDTGDVLPDITKTCLKRQYLVPNPVERDKYMELKQSSPARLGIWRAGPRFKTSTYLHFRADHSAAQDAVFSDVPQEFVEQCGLFTVTSQCVSKDEYITRPDLGRRLSSEGVAAIGQKCKKNPSVQIIVADGLSSSAVTANTKDVLPALLQGLESYKIDTGTPFFIRLGRVGITDQVSELTGAEVTCILIGERPGLITAESMSAYIAYRATVDMPESRRTVVSNIHRGGSLPVEAGAHIAEIIKLMLEKKASGTDLRL